ncbi:MAG: ATP-grasp domain-containing protein [Candidatus Dormibacteraeota bacterium]|nr:ATP-grasp domain-containing protein [Candidatus Dormibacteraeota bacterium]
MGRVLLLIPSRTYRTHDFMEAASRLDVEVVVGSPHRPALAALMDGRHLRIEFTDLDESVERIVAFASTRPLDAIVPVDDSGTPLASAASARLGLPQNPLQAVLTASNKMMTRRALRNAGLPTPRFLSFSVDTVPVDVASTIRYPCVVKPVDRSGSQGVIRVDESVAFPEAFTRVVAIVRSCDQSQDASLLVEDFVPGREVAVEGLLRGGELEVLAIFDKPDPLDGPFFEETIYVTPSRFDTGTQAAIVRSTAAATRALGLREGPVHAELRINGAEIFVLEVAPRSIGGLCSRTLRFGAGLSLEELILRHAAGLPMPAHDRERRAAGVMMLPIPAGGRLQEVRGQEEARTVPGVESLVVTVPAGERLVPLPEGDRYLGFLFARSDDPAAVETALREAFSRLTVVIHD